MIKLTIFFQFPLEIDFNNYITIANKKDNTNNNSLYKLKDFIIHMEIHKMGIFMTILIFGSNSMIDL